METTANVIAHIEKVWMKAETAREGCETALATKLTRDARNTTNDTLRKAKDTQREASVVLETLYRLTKAEGVSFNYNEDTYWRKVLRLRMGA